MRKGIATVSISGVLAKKLTAIAEAGFDGIEIFDNDLIASPLSPREIAARCADLGLTVDLFQPVRDIEGLPPDGFEAALHRFRVKLEVMAELGVSTVLVCSNVAEESVSDPDLTAEQLHRVGDLAADHGVTIAFEALAWGRHINRVEQAWEAVKAADHAAVTLAIDTFHMLARGDDGSVLCDVPGGRIGFLQVADAPVLDMNILDWSRHFRCFPGQGALDVTGVVAAALEAGYQGPLSLEVFSDVVREADPGVTARDAMRSLLFLEAELAGVLVAPAADLAAAAPPPSPRIDGGFLEIASPPSHSLAPDLLDGLGFACVGSHRSKPVTWWRNGEAHIVVNEGETTRTTHATALGVTAPPVDTIADRAQALLWPKVDTVRGADEAALPGLSTPSGLHVFISDARGATGDWQGDFVPTGATHSDDLAAIDHVGVEVAPHELNQEVAFFRTLFGLSPAPVQEFMEPHGRLRSRSLRPAEGDLRVILNVVESGTGHEPEPGVNQIAFACADVAATVQGLRSRGIALMAVPDNYYVDLDARFGLPADFVEHLRRHQLLYDRDTDGELLHAYTEVLPTGFYVEVLERRGGYDGYGASNTHVRLVAQASR
jgi:4-hydroxyphenylpyruvate dioxygenase